MKGLVGKENINIMFTSYQRHWQPLRESERGGKFSLISFVFVLLPVLLWLNQLSAKL
jgi:hypothetical protein